MHRNHHGAAPSHQRAALHLATLAAAAVAVAFIAPRPLVAATQTVALTGQGAPGPPAGLRFNAFSYATLDAFGGLFFEGSLLGGSGGVTAANDDALFYGAPGALSLLAREGSQAPGAPAGALFNSFGATTHSVGGAVAFDANLRQGVGGVTIDNDMTLWTTPAPALGSSLQLLFRESSPAPGVGLLFSGLEEPLVVNSSGRALFTAYLKGAGIASTNDGSIWVTPSAGAVPVMIAREGTQAPGVPAGALFRDFNIGAHITILTSSGHTALRTLLVTGGGGVTTANSVGIWAGEATPTGLTLVAREGTQAPDVPAGANFQGIGTPSLAGNGQLTFQGFLATGSGGVTDDNNYGIWAGPYDNLQLIAREGAQAPQMPAGTVYNDFGFYPHLINASGQVLFYANLRGPGVGAISGGLWAGSPTNLRLIARSGTQAPGAPIGALFNGFYLQQSLNAAGQVVFPANLQIGPGGITAANQKGLWISDLAGQSLLVIRAGDLLAGKTVLDFEFADAQEFGSDDNASGLNDFGQVAYSATFTDGSAGIFLYTPDLHWRAAGNGSWDTRTNWTLSTDPVHVHPVTIDPAGSLTVTGPASDTTVKSLKVGGGAGIATLRLQAGATLHVVDGSAIIDSTGVLTGDGTLSAGSPFSRGHIIAENLTLTDALENEGRITPNPAPNTTGRLNATVFNLAPGLIRVTAGQRLLITSLDNFGRVELDGAPAAPAELELTSASSNQPGGVIALRNAILRLGKPLTNAGVLSISFGAADVLGPVTNAATGQVLISSAQAAFHGPLSNAAAGAKVIVTAGASATFYGPVTNSIGSEFRVSQGSTATFFAPVTGDNFFTGLGAVNFEAAHSAVGALSVGSAHVALLASLDTNAFNVNSLSVEGAMRVVPNSSASRTSSLAIGDGASLDLSNNDLVIDSGDLAATLSHLASRRLFTSSATPITTLAILKNDRGDGSPLLTSFSSLAVDADDVLVKYTYYGDANLDGRVDILDFFAADRGRALRLSGWQNGDFDYTGGPSDASDYMLLDRSFLSQGAALSPLPHLATPPSAGSPVPEPTLLTLLLVPTLLLRRPLHRSVRPS